MNKVVDKYSSKFRDTYRQRTFRSMTEARQAIMVDFFGGKPLNSNFLDALTTLSIAEGAKFEVSGVTSGYVFRNLDVFKKKAQDKLKQIQQRKDTALKRKEEKLLKESIEAFESFEKKKELDKNLFVSSSKKFGGIVLIGRRAISAKIAQGRKRDKKGRFVKNK